MGLQNNFSKRDDDAKLGSAVNSAGGNSLQADVHRLVKWEDNWQTKFTNEKA